MKILENIGAYLLFIKKVFARPERRQVFLRALTNELEKLGLNSIVLVIIISFFIGAVLTLQTAYNMSNPLLPRYLIGYLTRETLLLEFSSTIVSLILAGKIGSNIASEIGTMRITEQIDALEAMGVNPVSYLVGPKIAAQSDVDELKPPADAQYGFSSLQGRFEKGRFPNIPIPVHFPYLVAPVLVAHHNVAAPG